MIAAVWGPLGIVLLGWIAWRTRSRPERLANYE